MKNLIQRFNQQWQQLTLNAQPRRIVLAFSGGVDSATLLDLLVHLPQQNRPQLSLAYFNHQLRSDSNDEEQLVKQIAADYQLPIEIGHWDHGQRTSEATARQARYDFLATVLQKTASEVLLTAHHGDDLLETILLKLIRSGELNELPGLRAQTAFRDWQLWRPLLIFSKEELRDYAAQNMIRFVEDSTNQSDFTPRNRLRHHVIPELQQENPQILTHANIFATELVAQQQLAHQFLGLWYEKMALIKKSDQISGTFPPVELDLMGWQLFWQDFIKVYLPNLQMCDHQQLKQIAVLTQTSSGHHRVNLQDGWFFSQTYQQFTFNRTAPVQLTSSAIKNADLLSEKYLLRLNQWQQVGQQSIGVFERLPEDFSGTITQLQVPTLPQNLTLRHRLAGDRVQLSNGHWQKLSRRQIDAKVPFDQRDATWVLVGDQRILWVQNIYHYKLSNVAETAKIIYVLIKN
ncbi:tRNA lysidine(34) synthetase TilS [Lapidilactobacillus bayanensis]|uniref:tRNA lysidine(34) synthetase TilS n=1 Tax=Lapidilactobacillus bayanensis TaxID=2485998 RepID=UPI000F76BE4E|nr:tRNA lysidine(34) synthetase TilS [Lapidilactobacillus bayanensis]